MIVVGGCLQETEKNPQIHNPKTTHGLTNHKLHRSNFSGERLKNFIKGLNTLNFMPQCTHTPLHLTLSRCFFLTGKNNPDNTSLKKLNCEKKVLGQANESIQNA